MPDRDETVNPVPVEARGEIEAIPGNVELAADPWERMYALDRANDLAGAIVIEGTGAKETAAWVLAVAEQYARWLRTEPGAI